MVVLDANQIFLIVLLIVLAIVVFFELRFMRSRNKEYMSSMVEKDNAYNTIQTTKAICNTLRQQGKDTKDAEEIIARGDNAYGRGEYILSMDLAKRAREALVNAPMSGISSSPVNKEAPDVSAKESIKNVQAVKRLEPNLIESRFIINSCRDRVQTEESSGKDLTAAKECLAKAETLFEAKRYDEALKVGLKARRMLGEAPAISPEVKDEAPVVKVQRPERKCASCGSIMDVKDQFCRKCGASLIEIRKCAHCQAEMAAEDAFCHQCGRNV